jgi:ABC-type uncharacterized transport system ATPase subunit
MIAHVAKNLYVHVDKMGPAQLSNDRFHRLITDEFTGEGRSEEKAPSPSASMVMQMRFEATTTETAERPPSARNSAAAIEARSLRRTFKGGIDAVRNIELTVSDGEIFGFLGPNGAGKTTTVRMLCTLLPPSAGSATVGGLDVVRDGAEVRIGVALQEIGLDPVQTGRELLELQAGLYGITGRRGRERAEELLELVGLTDAADRRTKTYSGGMKRRLDLASALVHAPEVLGRRRDQHRSPLAR